MLLPMLINGRPRRRKAPRKASRAQRTVRRVKRAAGRIRKRFSAAQLAAQAKFAAMVRKRSAGTRKARSVSARSTTPRRSGGSSMATTRRKRRKRRVSAAAPRKRRRRRTVRNGPVRRRRRRRPVMALRSNPRRRRHAVHHSRRRRIRRNPGLGGGVIKTLVQGAKDGFTVTVGRGLTKYVAGKIPFGGTSTIAQGAMQILVGAGLAMAVRKVTKSERTAAFFLAGAFSNVIQTQLAAVPGIGPMLSGGVGSWPRVGPGVGSWPRALPPVATGPTNTAPKGVGQPWGYDDPNAADGIFS